MTGRAVAVVVLVLGLAIAGLGWSREQRQRDAEDSAQVMTGGVIARGRTALRLRGCGSCHRIPGVAGADAMVGPPLDGFGIRMSIAGVLPNTADQLVRWLRHPQLIHPGTLMPEMGVGEQEARDIAAYLYALR